MVRPPWDYEDGVGLQLMELDYCSLDKRDGREEIEEARSPVYHECISQIIYASPSSGAVSVALCVLFHSEDIESGSLPAVANLEENGIVKDPLVGMSAKTTQVVCYVVVFCRNVNCNWKHMVSVAPFPDLNSKVQE